MSLPSILKDWIEKVKNWSTGNIEEYESKYSGTVLVRHGFGYRYIVTGSMVTQSGALIADLWSPVLKKIGQRQKTWLILGVAGGTLASVIDKKYAPKKIVGVEIDPIMIEIGQKYFKTPQIKSLTLIQADAQNYIKQTKEKFDYVLVDMYCGDELPKFVNTDAFIKQVKDLGTYVVFNHLFYGKKRVLAEEFIKKAEKHFSDVSLIRKLANLLVICK